MTNFTIHFTYVGFLEGFDLHILYYNKFITSWTSTFDDVYWEILFWEILLPSFGLIKHVHDVVNLLHYKHWTDKWKYILYISAAHKVLKSCISKIATLAHDVCHVHRAFSLYRKTCWQSLYRISLLGGWGSPPPSKNLLVHLLPTKFLLRPTKSQFNPPPQKKVKTSFLAVVIALVLFLFNFLLFWNTDHANFDFNWCLVFTKCCS